MKLTVC